MFRAFVCSFVIAVSFISTSSSADSQFNHWMEEQADLSRLMMLRNISPSGAARGAVIASPSKSDPDYFYHWIRDAALVMNSVVRMYYSARTASDKSYYDQVLTDYIRFSRLNQLTKTITGLGEPKFHADGRAFDGPWGRPQNDGPALRAITLSYLAFVWIREGKTKQVQEMLYDGKHPNASNSIIKMDLEYVANHWQQKSYDLWEEISGYNFYTHMTQRRALVLGAQLASKLGDVHAASYYLKQAQGIQNYLASYWDPNRRIVVSTRERNKGIDYKSSGMDSSVILASLHSLGSDGFMSPIDDRLLSTFERITTTFKHIYAVNSNASYPAVAIGRYPEDRYNGHNSESEGNPWFLTTAGFGEFLHQAANLFQARGGITVNSVNYGFFKLMGLELQAGQYPKNHGQFAAILQALRQNGDAFIARAGFHSDRGRMPEQINRNSGHSQGARDLTWSYASFLTAYWSRANSYGR